MIGPSGLYGLGLDLGMAEQLHGKEPRLCPPCDVDRLCDYVAWQIKGYVMIIMLDWDENNSPHALVRAGLCWGSFPQEGFHAW